MMDTYWSSLYLVKRRNQEINRNYELMHDATNLPLIRNFSVDQVSVSLLSYKKISIELFDYGRVFKEGMTRSTKNMSL